MSSHNQHLDVTSAALHLGRQPQHTERRLFSVLYTLQFLEFFFWERNVGQKDESSHQTSHLIRPVRILIRLVNFYEDFAMFPSLPFHEAHSLLHSSHPLCSPVFLKQDLPCIYIYSPRLESGCLTNTFHFLQRQNIYPPGGCVDTLRRNRTVALQWQLLDMPSEKKLLMYTALRQSRHMHWKRSHWELHMQTRFMTLSSQILWWVNKRYVLLYRSIFYLVFSLGYICSLPRTREGHFVPRSLPNISPIAR